MNEFEFSDFVVTTLLVEDTSEKGPTNPSSDNSGSFLNVEDESPAATRD